MPFTQLISPAGIGETLEVGNQVVTNGYVVDVIHPDGENLSRYPSDKFSFITRGAFLYPELTMDSSVCGDPSPIFLTLDGTRLLPVGGLESAQYGDQFVRLEYRSLEDMSIGDQGRYQGNTFLSTVINDLELDFTSCSAAYSALPFIFVEPRPNTGLIWVGGVTHSRYGTHKATPVQNVFPGWTDETIGSNHFITNEFGLLSLDKVTCHENSIAKYFPMPDTGGNAVLVLGKPLTLYGDTSIRNQHEFISPTGVDSDFIPDAHAVYELNIKLRVYETFCFILPGALQHTLGKAKGIVPFGVPPIDPQIGGHILIQGPPRINFIGDALTLYGTHSLDQPTPQNLVMDGYTDGTANSNFTVLNQQQFVYFNGEEFSYFNDDHEIVLYDRFIEPPGIVHSEYNDNHEISLLQRFVYFTGLDFLQTPTSHWVSRSPREINLFPNLDIFTDIGQPFIFERIFGAGLLTDYGQAHLYNTRQYMGPASLGNIQEIIPITHTVQLGLRYIDIQPTGTYVEFGNGTVWNYNSVIDIQANSNQFTEYGEYTAVNNLDKAIFMFSQDQDDIPLTHLVSRRPNQVLPIGEGYTEFGNAELQFYERRLYPQGWTYPVFTPGLYVQRQIVIAPTGPMETDFGNLDTTLLDLPYFFNGFTSGDYGNHLVDYAVRTLGPFYSGTFSEYTTSLWVKLQTQYIEYSSIDYSIFGPNTNVIEHFSRIIVATTDMDEIGGIDSIINRNKELGIESPLEQAQIGDHSLGHFLRSITFNGLTGTVGQPTYVGDNTQYIQFVGEDLSLIGGVNNIYLGQPWLPVNQIVKPSGEDHTDEPGNVEVSRFSRRVYPGPDTYTKYGTVDLFNNAIGPFTVNVTLVIGEPTIVAAVDQTITYSGIEFSDYGLPKFSPDYIYMTQDFQGSPYPGTPNWQIPDTGDGYGWDFTRHQSNPPSYGYLPNNGFHWIANEVRSIFPSAGNTTHIGAAEISSVLNPIGTQYIYPDGKRHDRHAAAFLSGGVKIRVMDPSETYTNIGNHIVSFPITPPGQTNPTEVSAGPQTQYGNAYIDFFHRRIYPVGITAETLIGTAWVSPSPRYIEPVGFNNSVIVGDHMVSFWIRHLYPDGDTFEEVWGFSFDDYQNRLKVIEYGLDSREVYVSASDTSEISQPQISRVAPCV